MYHRMKKKKKIIALQNGETEGYDEIGETEMMYKEDRRACCKREEEIGGKQNVQSKIRLIEKGQVTQHNKERVRNEFLITTDQEE